MKKEPRTQVIEFIDRKIAKEKDKFMSGMKSDYYEWEQYRDDFIDMVISLVNAKYDLIVMTKYLKEKQLFREYQQYHDSYVCGRKREDTIDAE